MKKGLSLIILSGIKDWHLIILSMGVVIFGYFLSFCYENPHLFQRSGSVVSSVTALFVILQVFFEFELEKEKEAIQNKGRANDLHIWQSKIVPRALIERVKRNIEERQGDKILYRRLRFVAIVAICTMTGELIHGFGDLIFEETSFIIENFIYIINTSPHIQPNILSLPCPRISRHMRIYTELRCT
jgi:hypothetical protein